MKSIFIVTLLITFLPFAKGQGSQIAVADVSGEWTSYVERSDMSLFYKKSTCIDEQNGISQELILLKVVNHTDHNVSIAFDVALWYDGKEAEASGSDELKRTFLIAPNDELEGSCGVFTDQSLQLFVRFTDKEGIPELTAFKIDNITLDKYDE